MSRYDEQHATTMLNALQGTDTLERYKQKIRADAIDECIRIIKNTNRHFYIDEVINKMEQLKERNNGKD